MRVNLIYFSQTKNTYQIAKAIAKGIENKGGKVILYNWLELRGQSPDRFIQECDLFGIGMPVFFYQAPWFIQEWLKSSSKFTEKPYFLFMSYAVIIGNAFRDVDNILRKKGLSLIGHEAFLGFGSYQAYLELPRLAIQYPDVYEDMKAKQFGERQIVNYVCWKNNRRNFLTRPQKASFFWRKKSFFLTKKIMNFISPQFKVNKDKCNGCGACAKNCPDEAIELKNGTPVFNGNCSRCYFCEKNCPQKAIINDWGDFRKKAIRYYNAYPDNLKAWKELDGLNTKHPKHI
ncbi:MAG: EFR1 family ferrodoxin [Candidatus Omnitrophota bacterium]